MAYSFIPFLLILGSLATIIVIIIRKFPQLSLLDIDNLPEIKEEQKKDEYIKKHAEKKAAEKTKLIAKNLSPMVQRAKEMQLSFRKYVGVIEKKAVASMTERRKKKLPRERAQEVREIKSILQEATVAAERFDYDSAEAKFIAVIRLDPKNTAAYRGLGDVYFVQKQFKEAKETFTFLLQIDPNDEHSLVKLAEIAEGDGNLEEAVEHYQQAALLNDNKSPRFAKIAQLLKDLGHYETSLAAIEQAVELEPENPKYLDFLAEISILVGDKSVAEAAYQQLRMVNPENQKLPILKDKIDQLK